MRHLAAIALACIAGVATAQDQSFDVSATTVGKSTSKYVLLGESHVYVDLNTDYKMPDTGTPVSGMDGNCFGYMEISIGAGANGGGTCVWTDADGDTWFGPWSVIGMTPERASHGVWHVSGGTGKFIGATGGGTFSALTNPQSGDSKLDVVGSMALK